MSNPRRANGYRRDQLRRRVLAEESECWLCHLPVDKSLPPHLDGSPEIDEVVPIAFGGDPLDRNNCRLSHRRCNVLRGQVTKRQKRTVGKVQPLTTARSW